MDSDFQQQQYQHHFQDFPRQQYQHHQKQQTSSLTRFRSAPSSYFASFLDVAADTVSATGGASGGGGGGGGGGRGDFANARPLSPETESIFARFMSNIGAEMNSSSQKPSNLPVNSSAQPEFTVRVKQETDIQQQQNQEQQLLLQRQQLQQQHMQQQQIQQGNYSDQAQMLYQIPSSKAPMSPQHSSAVSSAMQNLFGAAPASLMGSASINQMKTGIGGRNINNNSTLTRHSSSPAGFFANLDIDAGYGIMRAGMGNYGGGIEGNVQVNISSGQSNTSELMNRDSDVGAKRLRMDSQGERRFSNSSNNNNNDYEFPMNSWDNSILSENFSGLQGVQDEDTKIFPELNASENQSGESENRPPSLTHHLSLPKARPELSNMEKFLQVQDSVPLRIRAKRGCATHPRSIAERVRRTRISERMRKLQDLVPNMDKQTNTADMLDLAVDYIKGLQKQLETLADNRATCTCSR